MYNRIFQKCEFPNQFHINLKSIFVKPFLYRTDEMSTRMFLSVRTVEKELKYIECLNREITHNHIKILSKYINGKGLYTHCYETPIVRTYLMKMKIWKKYLYLILDLQIKTFVIIKSK